MTHPLYRQFAWGTLAGWFAGYACGSALPVSPGLAWVLGAGAVLCVGWGWWERNTKGGDDGCK